jgi:hypothetical protein
MSRQTGYVVATKLLTKEGEWGAEVAERIRRYVSTEKRWTVRLRDESPDE